MRLLLPRGTSRSLVGVLFLFLGGPAQGRTDAASATPTELSSGREQMAKLPLVFERNDGQAEPTVRFLGRGPGYKVYLTATEAITAFESADSPVIRMQLQGSGSKVRISGTEPFEHKTNYFIGSDSADHVLDVPNYGRVTYKAVYPGIDLVYYGNHGLLEYDLKIASGADPRQIKIRFSGAQRAYVNEAGALVLDTSAGDLTYQPPVAYQEHSGSRVPVDAHYVLADSGDVTFKLGPYDSTRPLTIDPILAYSTFLWEDATGLAVDTAGNAYLTGTTTQTTLPASNGYQTKLTGTQDAFVIKMNATGTAPVYATYLGVRRGTTWAYGIAVDAAGSAYVIGGTNSASFPTTTGAYQRTYQANASFVTKFTPAGNALAYSTFVNGANLFAIKVDAAGSAYVAGQATGTFALVAPLFTNGGCAIAKLNPAGSGMNYATLFGGDRCNALDVDAAGNVYVAGTTRFAEVPAVNAYQAASRGGYEAFAAKIASGATALLYSTYLGGSSDDYGNGIAAGPDGEAVIVGRSHSDDFPTTFASFQPVKALSGSGFSNAFVTKLSAAGSSLGYSSYLGGRWCFRPGTFSCFGSPGDGIDGATEVVVDGTGYAYVAGYTASADFPLADAPQLLRYDGNENSRVPFVSKITPTGDRLVYSVVLGITGDQQKADGLALDSSGNAYVAGYNGSAFGDYPLTAGMGFIGGGGFMYKLSNGNFPTTIESLTNPGKVGQTITLRARVLSPVAGGAVTFKNGSAVIGTAPVIGGGALLQTTLPAGAHAVTATYSLDGKVSPPIYQIVTSQ